MTIPMTTQPLGWWLNGEAGIPDSGERAPFLCTRCWCQLCSLPSPPASLLAQPHLLLSEVKSRASCLYVAARRSAQIVCLPRAPYLVWAGCPPYRPLMGTLAPLLLSPPGSRTLCLGCPGGWAWGVERGQARPSSPVPIPEVAHGPGSAATCSPPTGRGAALQRVPG